MYQTNKGKDIKTVEILFDKFSQKLPETLLKELDDLEYEIIGMAKVLSVHDEVS